MVVLTELAKEGKLTEVLYADDLVVMNETIEGLRNKFPKWIQTIKSDKLKVNLNLFKKVTFNRILRKMSFL